MNPTLKHAIAHLQGGRMEEARLACQSLLEGDAAGQAHHLLAVIAMHQGKLAEALVHCRKALAAHPQDLNFLNTMGVILKRIGEREQAAAVFEKILARSPGHIDALFNLGNLCREMGRLKQAERCYRKVLATQTEHRGALLGLGHLLREQGEMEAAEACFRQGLKTGDPAFLLAMGVLKFHGRQYAQAEDYLRHAVAGQPTNVDACFYLGNVLHAQGRVSEAESWHRRCTELAPGFVRAWNNLGNDLRDQGRHAEAAACFRRAIELDPRYMRAHSNMLLLMHYWCEDGAKILAEHRRWDMLHGQLPPTPHPRAMPSPCKRPLRIGFVSPDLCRHSVAYFLEGVWRHFDPRRVAIIAYADVAVPDAVTERLRRYVYAWRDIARLGDAEVAAQIAADEVDVLVDLAGHTAHHRLLVFARRPAPVQITYLGYPATTGMRAMDYRICDAVTDPEGAERFCSEKLIRLPRCFLAYLPPIEAPAVAPAPAQTKGWVTFGSFNHMAKITPKVLRAWAAILRQVPRSRLLLKHFSLADAGVRKRLCEEFQTLGVDAGRITTLSWSQGIKQHLACYNQVDIALDTFPYNGTTTTCEALWMGVPVITMAGKLHAGRVGASLLAAADCGDWVGMDEDDYVAKACRLAADLARLAKIRRALRGQMQASPLCDGAGLARALEDAFIAIVQRLDRPAPKVG